MRIKAGTIISKQGHAYIAKKPMRFEAKNPSFMEVIQEVGSGLIELKGGDILTCYSRSWLARAIQWFTKSKYNHSALVMDVFGRLFVSDSQKDGTNPRPLEEWIKEYSYGYEVHRPVRLYDNTMVRAASKWGHTPYDFASLLWWFPLYVLTKKWRGKKGDDATKAMYCSEYVSWVYRFDEWWRMSPQDLFDKLEESNDFKRL